MWQCEHKGRLWWWHNFALQLIWEVLRFFVLARLEECRFWVRKEWSMVRLCLVAGWWNLIVRHKAMVVSLYHCFGLNFVCNEKLSVWIPVKLFECADFRIIYQLVYCEGSFVHKCQNEVIDCNIALVLFTCLNSDPHLNTHQWFICLKRW